ncbi:MAG: hypothetical protein R3A51_16200 [Nannocystaceae bacterium]|nr:hypothetical protein [Myxococcales bacterium]
MHESGMIRALIATARAEATRRGGLLRGIHVRLGALAGGSPEHLREHLEIEARALGLGGLELHLTQAPDRPTGVELTAIELSEPSP